MDMAVNRRALLKTGLAVGGGLLIGFRLQPRARAATAPAQDFAPNAFIRIAPDNTITLLMSHTEFGQGIYTSACMLIAEELEVGLDQVTPEPAPPNNALYTDPNIGEQATGGSTSTVSGFLPLRQAGATARVMLIEAAAQQWHVDPGSCTASHGEVIHTDSGRRLSYGALAGKAALRTPPKDVKLKDSAAWKLIGTKQPRLDTPSKVNGAMRFGIDIRVPGMKFATVAASPVQGGQLRGIDEVAARAVPGVRDIVKLDDLVAVVADHTGAAIAGLRAANPQWDDGPHANISTASLIKSMDEASQGAAVVAKSVGDAHAAIAGSAKKLEAVYQLPFLAHAPMEPINTTLHIRPDGADLWVGTQVPPRAQAAVAKIAGLKPEQVTVHNQYMGGAFGRRLEVDSVFQAARIAKTLPYPVQITWTREEDIQHDMVRPYYYDRLSAGLDAQGRITGWTHRTTGSAVTARFAPEGMDKNGTLDPDAVEGAVAPPYNFATQLNEFVRHEPAGVPTGWWRGVGPTHNIFVVESFIDELAAAAGTDPLTFRRAMLAQNPRALAALNLAAEKSGWGIALPAGQGRGIALQFAFGSYVATVLRIAVSPQGEIKLIEAHTAVDCGPVVNPDTVEAQIQGGLIFGLSAAMFSEITLANGRVEQSNFHDYRALRINEAPDVHVHIIASPTAAVGGIGETGTASAAGALANAIFAATGKRLRRLPLGTGQLGAA